jgi:hypothetical protein
MSDYLALALQIAGLVGIVAVPIGAIGLIRGDIRWVTRREWKAAEAARQDLLVAEIVKPLERMVMQMDAMARAQVSIAEQLTRQDERRSQARSKN